MRPQLGPAATDVKGAHYGHYLTAIALGVRPIHWPLQESPETLVAVMFRGIASIPCKLSASECDMRVLRRAGDAGILDAVFPARSRLLGKYSRNSQT